MISGAAGLLLVLCRFKELYETEEGKHAIRVCAGRLLALKTLEQKEHPPLWDTLRLGRPVSGMGHGMSGIAAALMRAYRILGHQEYGIAAQDALDFEYRIYEFSLNTWPDLRASSRPSAFMHGYCSGAPGIGLAMLICLESGSEEGGCGTCDRGKNRYGRGKGEESGCRRELSEKNRCGGNVCREDRNGEGADRMCACGENENEQQACEEWRQKAKKNLNRALAACWNQELLFRDHLCCGNSAAVDFLLEAGLRLKRPELMNEAGEILCRMAKRKAERGNYTFLPSGYVQTFDPSLFYGAAGVGYEMLRLAEPEKIESLLL